MGKRKSYFTTLNKWIRIFSFSKPLDILFLLYTSRLKAIFQEGIFNVQSALNWTFQSFYPPHTKNYENKISWQFFQTWRTWKLSWWHGKKILFSSTSRKIRFCLILIMLSRTSNFSNLHPMRCLNFGGSLNFWGAETVPPTHASAVNRNQEF